MFTEIRLSSGTIVHAAPVHIDDNGAISWVLGLAPNASGPEATLRTLTAEERGEVRDRLKAYRAATTLPDRDWETAPLSSIWTGAA